MKTLQAVAVKQLKQVKAMRFAYNSLLLALLVSLSACGDFFAGGAGTGGSGISTSVSSYISANQTTITTDNLLPIDDAVTASDTSTTATDQTVEEGNIYRNIENSNLIINVNPYRGVQIINTADVSKPKVIGTAALAGNPDEMYQVGNYVYVLMHSLSDYHKKTSVDGKQAVVGYRGAAVVVVDVSNKTAPKVIQTKPITGNIVTSRMTHSQAGDALYVATTQYANGNAQGQVQSFALDVDGPLNSKNILDLGGYVQAVAATSNRLMVASNQYYTSQGSNVTVVDISSPTGAMVKGATVQVSGNIKNKTNMNIEGDILRVVSGSTWSGSSTNHIETFSVADIHNITAIDHKTFGDWQQLFGTTFMPDRAFFVTYLRKDPLHAFSISSTGQIGAENQFETSGWNDFFTPVYGNTRMIGVGTDDANSKRTMSVSLYDTTDVANPSPLLARANVALDSSWSDASYDDKAFSVLENAVNIAAPNGTVETGLVLLPFSGYNGSYQSGVQIFTFSATTLTARGVMIQDQPVNRSFMAKSIDKIVGNLSSNNLSLFNVLNPNTPIEKSKLELAPNYSNLVPFNQYAVRYHSGQDYWGWWGNNSNVVKEDTLEIIPLSGDVNITLPVATIKVPVGSQIYNVGGHLAVVSNVLDKKAYTDTSGNVVPTSYKTHIATWDISTPSKPKAEGVLDATGIVTQDQYDGFRVMANTMLCMGWCAYNPNPMMNVNVIGNTLVFANTVSHKTAITSNASVKSYNYTASYTLDVVDLTKPSKPVQLAKMTMPENEQAVTLLPDGNRLWINYKIETAPDQNGKTQATYYIKPLELANPSVASIGKAVNIAGELVAIAGSKLYSKDYYWKGDQIRNTVNMAVLQDDKAYLQAYYKFEDDAVTGVKVDNGHVLVSHGRYGAINTNSYGTYIGSLSILDVVDQTFTVKSTVDLSGSSGSTTLLVANQGKALLAVDGGILMYNVSDVSKPIPQAFLAASTGWYPQTVITQDTVYYPAGAYGIYQIGLNTINLLEQEN